MRFAPKSQKQIDEDRLLPEAEYPFQVSGGEDKVSKSGNEMIKLTVRVFKPDGNFILVDDYLLESIAYKLRHAAEACDLTPAYESGQLAGEMFIGKTGSLKLKIQKDKNAVYPDKNVIGDYVVPKAGVAKAPLPKKDDFISDEIPF
jgi:hypothetical protein